MLILSQILRAIYHMFYTVYTIESIAYGRRQVRIIMFMWPLSLLIEERCRKVLRSLSSKTSPSQIPRRTSQLEP